MEYTKPKKHLDNLYTEAHLKLTYKDILEIPPFLHNGCQITVTYLPVNKDTDNAVIAVKIRTHKDVIFTPFYLKENINGTYEFVPYFDTPEYMAIKEPIINRDNYSTIPLFNDIAMHILNCTPNDVIRQDGSVWAKYRGQRTAHPCKANDNVLPMTIKNVGIGDISRKRIYRMFPYDEAKKIVNALWKNKKTIVFTPVPSKARNIYAILSKYQIFIER